MTLLKDEIGHRTRSWFVNRSVYFIGIGGCGMSGLARLIRAAGARACAGSDSVATEVTDQLREDGFAVTIGRGAGGLPSDCDCVVATAAVSSDNPQMCEARARGIPVLTYAEALGCLQQSHTTISIAGTHGKSTTTAILAHVLIRAGLDPSVLVGAMCGQIGGGSRIGGQTVPHGALAGIPGLLLAEACEFNRSFHHHRPTFALINNVEPDHLDVYGSFSAVIEAFCEFAHHVPSAEAGGKLLISYEARRLPGFGEQAAEVATFGCSADADFEVRLKSGRVAVMSRKVPLVSWQNPMPGRHNALNAAAAAILAHWCGAEWREIDRALESFAGVSRRMERLGSRAVRNGACIVYDDYGHHPTEVRATLRALREHEKPQRVICVFQPHQHSRTRLLLDDFAHAFADADITIVPDIYFVRDPESERAAIDGGILAQRIAAAGSDARYVPEFDDVVAELDHLARDGDLVVIMGAGPVWQVARDFMAEPERQPNNDSVDQIRGTIQGC